MDRYVIETPHDLCDLIKYTDSNKYKRAIIEKQRSTYRVVFDEKLEEFLFPMSQFDNGFKLVAEEFIKSIEKKTKLDKLIFGKNETSNIVSCEVTNEGVELFIEKDGIITTQHLQNFHFILCPERIDSTWIKLQGNLHYSWVKLFNHQKSYLIQKAKLKAQGKDIFYISDPKEAAMVLHGFTYYKGMKVEDVSVLSFDIESVGLSHSHQSKVLIISNTFVKNGVTVRKLFCYDDYSSDKEFFDAWCKWVRDINPSIICGFNLFSFDLPYLSFCATNAGTTLALGRDGSDVRIDRRVSQFRKDGSQSYEYKRAFIYGREIVDVMFTSYRFDVQRKYESYRLKQIIRQEKLEKEDRIFYDASLIRENYKIKEEWEKIKLYAMFDADDGYSLFKLQIPSYFYLAQCIPKPFQAINYTATGSQINAFLVRSYFQNGHSLPKSSVAEKYEGAIVGGLPGIYRNVFKVDVASLYPSIMLEWCIYDSEKDPERHFLKMVEYFTVERLSDKKKASESSYYKQLSEAKKIVINSAYGLLGAPGLLFNSPKKAALVTQLGREILTKAIKWCEGP